MEESILISIKKMIGIAPSDESFDSDLVMHINSVFSILTQLGVGPEEGYSISSSSNTWDEIIDENERLSLIKSYIALKVKMIFDPPQSSAVANANASVISELEWRILSETDYNTNDTVKFYY